MSTNFPASLDTLENPAATDGLTGHAAQHANANDAIAALQAKVGITGSADAASLDYRVATVESGKVDKVVGKQLSTEDYSTAEQSKLAGIEAGANAYTHPETHPATMIVADSTHRFVTDTQTAGWDSKADGTHVHAISDVTGLTTALSGKLDATEKGAANGLAPLGADSKIAATYLPSYVDDVLEYANTAGFPAIGETAKIYVALDTNKTYRWSGSAYAEISASPGTTDALTEGATNLYFTTARARAALSATGAITYDSATGVISATLTSGYASKTVSANTTLAADTEYETGRNLRINHGVNLAIPASTKLIVRKYAAGSSL